MNNENCKYCNENNKHIGFLVKNNIGIEGNELVVYDGEYIIRDIVVNYCPMCGRNLT